MKHTKGPWTAEISETYEIWNQNTKIAVINEAHETEVPVGTDLANANLIAAAPEMLEALERAAAALQDSEELALFNGGKVVAYHFEQSDIDAIKAALAKARGDSA